MNHLTHYTRDVGGREFHRPKPVRAISNEVSQHHQQPRQELTPQQKQLETLNLFTARRAVKPNYYYQTAMAPPEQYGFGRPIEASNG